MQPPDMLRSEGSGGVSMFPRMIEMIVDIVPSCVVSDPAIIFRVNVRRGGMTGRVLKSSPLLALRV